MEIEKKEIAISATKILLGAIPYFGTALNESIFEYRSRIKQQRINDFIESLSDYIGTLTIKNPNVEHIQSEEFGDIFESIIRKVSENRSKEKAERFKLILANQLVNPSKLDFADTYLDIISKLNEKQIEILKAHQQIKFKNRELETKIEDTRQLINQLTEKVEQLKQSARKGVIEESIAENEKSLRNTELALFNLEKEHQQLQVVRESSYYNIEAGEFLFYLQDMVAKSLIADVGIGGIGTLAYNVMEITEFGSGLLKFIQD